MDRKIPDVGCHWNEKSTDDLGSCHFEIFFCKIDEIPVECGGTPRKQTKQETIAEGLMAMHNAQAAANLVGSKFMISRRGQRLHVTTLPADVLRKFNLPEDYAATVTPLSDDDCPAPPSPAASFGGFANSSPGSSASEEDKRLGLSAKCMFMQLAASLDIIYADENEDLYIAEVKAKPNPTSLAEAVFDNGEHFAAEDCFNISFGLLKQVEA
jgi:hypothetical protein